jgi:hypothetical protein
MEVDLLVICALAFVGVFVLLAFLALVMRVLVSIFPELVEDSDAAVVAAMAAVVSTIYPGTKVTKVQEE